MSCSGCSSPELEMMSTTVTTTASYEQQVILDLQAKLGHLAQQNRDSIAKALSAAKATRSASSKERQSAAVPSTAVAPHPPKDDALLASSIASCPDSIVASVLPAGSLPELAGISNDLHPLTLSKSTPGQSSVSSGVPGDLAGAAAREGHQPMHPAMTADPVYSQSRDPRLPELPYSRTNPLNRNQLERQLQGTKAHVLQLDSKLKKCNEICEQQKLHFRSAIIDLQTKLNDTIVGRNSVLELRRREAESQERLINQLQETFADVEASNEQQAQVLQDASCKVAGLHAELQACHDALAQIDALTARHATKCGLVTTVGGAWATCRSPKAEELGRAVGGMLRAVLESYERELESAGKKAVRAEKELREAQEQFAVRWKENGEQQKEMLRKLREEQEQQLTAATERALNARKQTLSLQAQLTLAQEQMQQLTDNKNSQVAESHQRLEKLQDEAESVKNRLATKCDTLTSDLEASQQQCTESTEENSRLVHQIQNLQQQLQDAKDSIAKAEDSVETLQRQNHQLSSLEQESNIRLGDLKTRLEGKTSECQELSRLVEEVREESARQAEQKVSALAEKSRHDIASLTDDMTSQIGAVMRQRGALAADLQRRDAELADALAAGEASRRALTDAQRELGRAAEEKADATRRLEETGKELEVLRGVKERIAESLAERSSEVDLLQSIRDQLQVQVNERDMQCVRLQEQTSSMAQLAEVTSKAGEDWKQERSQMKQTLDAQTEKLRDLKLLQENLSKKLRVREKRLRTVEEDNKRLEEEAQGTVRESQTAIRSKEELRAQLQQARTQMDLLTIEQEKLKAEIQAKEVSHQREASKNKSKVQALQRELLIAQKTIKATAAMDGKAVQVAERMQKQVTAKRSEIDALQGDINWLKECLDATRKDKSALAGDRDFYKAQVSEMNKNNENRLKEQENAQDTRSLQSTLVAKLEESLKKASLKHAECKAVIARQEQDIVRLKLKHQLEIKELQRSLTQRTGPPATNPRQPPVKAISPPAVKTAAAISSRADTPPRSAGGTQSSKIAKGIRREAKPPPRRTNAGSSDGHEDVYHSAPASSESNPDAGRLRRGDSPQSGERLSPIISRTTAERDRVPSHGVETRAGPPQTDAAPAGIFSQEELRALLREMHGVVASQPVLPKGRHASYRLDQPASVQTATGVHPTGPDMTKRYQDSGNNNTVESGYSTRAAVKQGKPGMMTTPLLTSSPVVDRHRSPRPDNLSLLSSVLAVWDSPPVIPETDVPARPRSPVASLLGSSPANDSRNNSSRPGALTPTSFESMESAKVPDAYWSWREGCSLTTSSIATSLDGGSEAMRPQNEQLRLLQDKLRRLCELGGHLQQENKDMASMIKQQDTRIKKCRRQEQQAQRLVSEGR